MHLTLEKLSSVYSHELKLEDLVHEGIPNILSDCVFFKQIVFGFSANY